jgi:flagellar biosynthesis/type III secretory pathway protein FliH
MAREEVEARLTAERIVREANEQAEAILRKAKADSSATTENAWREGELKAETMLAARWLALRQAEAAHFDNDTERVIGVAVALAERLLGDVLDLAPERIASLAAVALDEARGARRAVIRAHPIDAEALRRLGTSELEPRSISVQDDEAMPRGSMEMHTDVGIITARLPARLQKLAAAVRDAMGTK